MNSLARVTDLMVRFEVAHNCKPNIIMLGFDAHNNFTEECAMTHPWEREHSEDTHGGLWFRGCRVLRTDSPGVWVGRVIESQK